jgi:hypothetical protein
VSFWRGFFVVQARRENSTGAGSCGCLATSLNGADGRGGGEFLEEAICRASPSRDSDRSRLLRVSRDELKRSGIGRRR